MNGLTVIIGQLVIFLAALAGIVFGSIMTLNFAAQAQNRVRDQAARRRAWALAGLSLCGIVASAGLGFVGLAALMYFAQV